MNSPLFALCTPLRCARFPALLLLLHIAALLRAAAELPSVGSPLPPWREGELDIHHINTGRGESSFFILPDGTTLLVDAGDIINDTALTLARKPNGTRAPGEWISRYIARALENAPVKKLDYALLSHFHEDHMGTVDAKSRRSRLGDYALSGITDVAEQIQIDRLLDRGWPDYNWPVPQDDSKMKNYRRFIAWQTKNRGMQVEQFEPGRGDQLVLRRNPAKYPNFEIRNLIANGRVWTGVGTNTRNIFPPLADLPKEEYPSENKCCIGFRLSYGSFDYFSGGDLDVRDVDVAAPSQYWKDVETPVAMVTGPVEAMKANHHGNYDANSAAFLGILRPRVIVIDTRGSGQPAINVYRRMISKATYLGPRDIFATNVTEATSHSYGVDKLKSQQGHVVLRVSPGGASYLVCVLDDATEEARVKAVFGPYEAR